ncbi:hypothetical protein AKO1_012644 [Acrasis kona]|uniref:DUF1772 domain-containing protein n=1 Tax=Acrasis kona TaxID=1008807 RepID=A0AAW2YVN9_9EUKA
MIQYLLLFTSIACTSTFADAAIYITLVEHASRLELSPSAARDQFKISYPKAAKVQSTLASISALTSVLNLIFFNNTWVEIFAIALNAVTMVGIYLLTISVIMPTNKKLLSNETLTDVQVKGFLKFWDQKHNFRTLASTLSTLTLFVVYLSQNH